MDNSTAVLVSYCYLAPKVGPPARPHSPLGYLSVVAGTGKKVPQGGYNVAGVPSPVTAGSVTSHNSATGPVATEDD